jgi:hypothetical protein
VKEVQPSSVGCDHASPAPAASGRAAGTHGAEVLQLQRAAGNRATQQALQRGLLDTAKRFLGITYVADVEGEQVVVVSKGEESEAGRIIKRVEGTYGVDISAMKGARATKDAYKNAPAKEVAKVKAVPWRLRELKAVERALAHFAPILGKLRAKSSRSQAAQEVTSVGKVNYSITRNSAKGVIDPATLGEFYRSAGNFSLYKPSESHAKDFGSDVDKQLEGTTVHEISHGVMAYAIGDFIAATGFWLDEDTESKDAKAEAPPTGYGRTNAHEDLCESMMLYFVDRARLKSTCPRRHALIERLVKEWTAPPVGDFPLPDPAPDVALA